MAKRVAAEDKAHDSNERINHVDNKTRRDKHVSNIIIQDEKKKAHDITEDAQLMMKEYHEKRRSHQCGVDLLMFLTRANVSWRRAITRRWSVISRPSTPRRI